MVRPNTIEQKILDLVDQLGPEQREQLLAELCTRCAPNRPHSVRDLQPASVGRILVPLDADDDLLDEMTQR